MSTPTGATAGLARDGLGRPGGSIGAADSAAPGQRAVPYHCPFCAEEDLRPHPAQQGAWHCRSCLRVFSVRFLGLEHPDPARTPDPHPFTDPTGGIT